MSLEVTLMNTESIARSPQDGDLTIVDEQTAGHVSDDVTTNFWVLHAPKNLRTKCL